MPNHLSHSQHNLPRVCSLLHLHCSTWLRDSSLLASLSMALQFSVVTFCQIPVFLALIHNAPPANKLIYCCCCQQSLAVAQRMQNEKENVVTQSSLCSIASCSDCWPANGQWPLTRTNKLTLLGPLEQLIIDGLWLP